MYSYINRVERENIISKLKCLSLVKQNKVLQNSYIYRFFKDNRDFDDKFKFIQFARDIQIVKKIQDMIPVINTVMEKICDYSSFELDIIMDFFNILADKKYYNLISKHIKELFVKYLECNIDNIELLTTYIKTMFYCEKIHFSYLKKIDNYLNKCLKEALNYTIMDSDIAYDLIDYFDYDFSNDKLQVFYATQEIGDIEGYELYFDPDEMSVCEIKLVDNHILEFLKKYENDAKLYGLLSSFSYNLAQNSQTYLSIVPAKDNSGIVILSEFPDFNMGKFFEGYSNIIDYCKSKLSLGGN